MTQGLLRLSCDRRGLFMRQMDRLAIYPAISEKNYYFAASATGHHK
ncbi:hypothetical protein [Methylobacterium sp. JK268]